ncbi:hypothetical protein ZWY2020_030072 [Hordeum vulgare]|nr:hypothetical protein ZWY2020_030072 [Hordeum vulgare]
MDVYQLLGGVGLLDLHGPLLQAMDGGHFLEVGARKNGAAAEREDTGEAVGGAPSSAVKMRAFDPSAALSPRSTAGSYASALDEDVGLQPARERSQLGAKKRRCCRDERQGGTLARPFLRRGEVSVQAEIRDGELRRRQGGRSGVAGRRWAAVEEGGGGCLR